MTRFLLGDSLKGLLWGLVAGISGAGDTGPSACPKGTGYLPAGPPESQWLRPGRPLGSLQGCTPQPPPPLRGGPRDHEGVLLPALSRGCGTPAGPRTRVTLGKGLSLLSHGLALCGWLDALPGLKWAAWLGVGWWWWGVSMSCLLSGPLGEGLCLRVTVWVPPVGQVESQALSELPGVHKVLSQGHRLPGRESGSVQVLLDPF